MPHKSATTYNNQEKYLQAKDELDSNIWKFVYLLMQETKTTINEITSENLVKPFQVNKWVLCVEDKKRHIEKGAYDIYAMQFVKRKIKKGHYVILFR